MPKTVSTGAQWDAAFLLGTIEHGNPKSARMDRARRTLSVLFSDGKRITYHFVREEARVQVTHRREVTKREMALMG
jgi:hypothetical protein